MDISELNSLPEEVFVEAFKNVVEHHKQCALHLSKLRPFVNQQAIFDAASAYLDERCSSEITEILCSHPDLAGRITDESHLTEESQNEQKLAGLRSISMSSTKELAHYLALYKVRFGFPFIICARENKFEAIRNGVNVRLHNTRDEELKIAFNEVKKIVYYRLKDLVK